MNYKALLFSLALSNTCYSSIYSVLECEELFSNAIYENRSLEHIPVKQLSAQELSPYFRLAEKIVKECFERGEENTLLRSIWNNNFGPNTEFFYLLYNMEVLFGDHKKKTVKKDHMNIINGSNVSEKQPVNNTKNQHNVVEINDKHAITCKKIIKHENKSMSVELSDGSIINIPKPGEHAQRSLTKEDAVRSTLIRLYIKGLADKEIPVSKKANTLNPKINPIKHEGPIIILDTTAQDLIDEITSKQKNTVIGVHNFTNRKQLGGGALNGRMAQEESLMYYFPEVLLSYLKVEGNRGNDFFLQRGDVMVTKTEKNKSKIVVLASALPWIYSQNQQKVTLNNKDIGANEKKSLSLDEYIQIIDNAILNLIKSACDNGVEVLITGAWGSGVYNNDPNLISQRFKEILNSKDPTGKLWKENFESIIFAIPGKNSENYKAYNNVFNK